MRAEKFLLASMATLLASCFGDDQSELREWMDVTRRETPVRIDKIEKPKDFAPFEYRADNRADPFDPAKLVALLQRLAEKSSKGNKPDMERRREPLEAYPLDSVKMVGVMQREKLTYALITADQTLHQVKIGSYVGQNFGMVTRITETEIFIKELVQDAAGDWVERDATLQLQEGLK